MRRVLPFLLCGLAVYGLLVVGFSPWAFAAVFWGLALVRVWRWLFRSEGPGLDLGDDSPRWASDRRRGGYL